MQYKHLKHKPLTSKALKAHLNDNIKAHIRKLTILDTSTLLTCRG